MGGAISQSQSKSKIGDEEKVIEPVLSFVLGSEKPIRYATNEKTPLPEIPYEIIEELAESVTCDIIKNLLRDGKITSMQGSDTASVLG
jgi:predicted methyltransferase